MPLLPVLSKGLDVKRTWPLVALCMVCLFAIFGQAGCGTGRTKDAKNPLEGEWVDVAGGGVKFSEDTFYPSGGESGPRYEYKLISEARISLTPVAVEDGIESADTEATRVERYKVAGDTLEMDSLWDRYYRPGSEALEVAKAAKQKQAGDGANTAEAKLELSGCLAVMSTYGVAFENWFDKAYPDRSSHGYSVGDYIRLKRLPIDWDFGTLKQKVATEYAGAGTGFGADIGLEADPAEYTIAGWVTAGTCPSGGTYSTAWSGTQDSPPQLECSIHGKSQ